MWAAVVDCVYFSCQQRSGDDPSTERILFDSLGRRHDLSTEKNPVMIVVTLVVMDALHQIVPEMAGKEICEEFRGIVYF